MTVHDLIDALPDITAPRDRTRALAMLDAVVCEDLEARTYLFDSKWQAGRELASMSNGQGDEYSIVFDGTGVFIRGFDHESPLTPFPDGALTPGLTAGLPDAFAGYLDEPSFGLDGFVEATVCVWRQHGEPVFLHGDVGTRVEMLALHPGTDDPDGANWLFELLTTADPAPAYLDLAQDAYEHSVDLASVRHVLALQPFTPEILHLLSGGTPPQDFAEELTRIGYPR